MKEQFWWFIHNVFAHPISELLYWVGLQSYGNKFHDWTVPNHKPGSGRG